MKHVVVDPITRIEGHLRVEIQVDEATGKVTDAISSGTAWRGLELVMNDRDPRDAWAYIQRICGVCTSSHALGCLRAVEDAFGITIPKNAHYIRNIIAACLGHQDHIIHFYHLHALDWVSPLEALKADPAATAALQNTVLATYRLPFRGPQGLDTEAYPHDFPVSNADYYAAIQAKVQKIVESGQLGIFSAQWWDHPDYQMLPPEVHLMAISHYLEMLDKQRDLVVPHVVFGGKNPHPHYCLGGMPCSISMEDGNAPINAARLAIVDRSIQSARHMMNDYYLPDVLAIGHLYVQKGYVSGGGLAKERVLGFGNKNPTSYFRLVPHQEAPTNVCWGMSNRSVLVRVPLGWTSGEDMCHKANETEPLTARDYSGKQTVEMRSPDASADIYQLLAGLCVACRHGFEMANAEAEAERTFADGDIHDPKNAERYATLAQLPDSCAASADCLERQRKVYEEYDVFSPAMIDGIIKQLRAFNDRTLRQEIEGKEMMMEQLVRQYFHCG